MAIKSQKIKIDGRKRSKIRIRKRLSGSASKPRISVFKSSKHIYAQAVSDENGSTIASASTLEKEVLELVPSIVSKLNEGGESKGEGKGKGAKEKGAKQHSSSSKSVAAARAVGVVLAKRILAKNISEATFDRNGFVYHGRIGAVADGARGEGIKF